MKHDIRNKKAWIKRWWALKRSFYTRVNKIAEEEFGKKSRDYKKLNEKRKKLVDSKFWKIYRHALMQPSGAKRKFPSDRTLIRVCAGHQGESKTPTNADEKRRMQSFFKNRTKNQAAEEKTLKEKKKEERNAAKRNAKKKRENARKRDLKNKDNKQKKLTKQQKDRKIIREYRRHEINPKTNRPFVTLQLYRAAKKREKTRRRKAQELTWNKSKTRKGFLKKQNKNNKRN